MQLEEDWCINYEKDSEIGPQKDIARSEYGLYISSVLNMSHKEHEENCEAHKGHRLSYYQDYSQLSICLKYFLWLKNGRRCTIDKIQPLEYVESECH